MHQSFSFQQQKPQATKFHSRSTLFFKNALFFCFLSLSLFVFFTVCCILKKYTHPIINLIRTERTCMFNKRMPEKDLKFHSLSSLVRFFNFLFRSRSLSVSFLLCMEEKTERISIHLSKYVYIHLKSG